MNLKYIESVKRELYSSAMQLLHLDGAAAG